MQQGISSLAESMDYLASIKLCKNEWNQDLPEKQMLQPTKPAAEHVFNCKWLRDFMDLVAIAGALLDKWEICSISGVWKHYLCST